MRSTLVLACLACLAGPSAAQSAGVRSTVYASGHELLVAAIRDGSAAGVMQGAVAAKFTSQFHSNGVLLAAADVIGSFPRGDCKRLLVRYTKQDVVGPRGPQDVALTIKMNYCLDGRPPTELEVAR